MLVLLIFTALCTYCGKMLCRLVDINGVWKAKINIQGKCNHENKTVEKNYVRNDIPEIEVTNISTTVSDNMFHGCGKSQAYLA